MAISLAIDSNVPKTIKGSEHSEHNVAVIRSVDEVVLV